VAGGKVRGHFTTLPRVLFPQPSPTDRWFTSGNLPGHTQAGISQPPLSRVSSVSEKGWPFCPYHFSSATIFATLVASQRGYLIHLAVQLQQHVMQGWESGRINLFTSNPDFFWTKVPLCPQFQCKSKLQNRSFDDLQPEMSFSKEIYFFF